jgi:hypothetical protein
MHLRAALKQNPANNGAEMEASLRGATNFNDRSDYAVALMYLGRSREAVVLLSQLEKEQPGHFFIAANLGTAYELSGQNGEALQWINEGIRRNPQDHEGTEWLHARILEAKLAQEQDAAFFEKHSVLELHPGKMGESMTVAGREISPTALIKAIQYQLGERLQFVKPPDPAVASLLFDYAALEAALRSMESARQVLKLALDYGCPPPKVQALDQELARQLAWEHFKTYAIYGSVGALVVALLIAFYRRGNLVIFR